MRALRHCPRGIARQQAAAHDDAQQSPPHALLHVGEGLRIEPGGFPEHDRARRRGLERAIDDQAVKMQVGIAAEQTSCGASMPMAQLRLNAATSPMRVCP